MHSPVRRFLTDRHQRRRSGTVTVMVLVVILIMSGMVAQVVRRVVLDRRQAAQELLHRQTQELAAAGMRRVKLQRQIDPDWTGETWNPDTQTVSETNQAEVAITIHGSTATVVARYPVNHPHPIQITRHVDLEE
jgi:type II secretory pathway component PulK